eukprot:3545465-Prymnesium_polylepis.1
MPAACAPRACVPGNPAAIVQRTHEVGTFPDQLITFPLTLIYDQLISSVIERHQLSILKIGSCQYGARWLVHSGNMSVRTFSTFETIGTRAPSVTGCPDTLTSTERGEKHDCKVGKIC